MANKKQTFEELEQHLKEAHQLIAALRGGEIDSVDAIVTKLDVTMLRAGKLEAELQQSERNFHRSLDDSPMGIRIVSSDGETTYANRAILDIYGYDSIEELNATPVKKRYTGESYAEHQVRKGKRQRGEYVPSQYEISIVRKDGEIRHLGVLRKEVLWNDKTQFQVLYNDVTERKKAEEALRESEQRYRLLIDNANESICVAQDGLIKFVNQMMLVLFGRDSEQELIDRPYLEFIHPDDRHIVVENHRRRIKNEAARARYDFRVITREGIVKWVEMNAALTEWQGKPATLNFLTDITERKQAEKEKQLLEEKAQVTSRLAAVGEMAAGIAHEINNPLTGVLGFSQLLLEKQNIPEEIKEELKIITDGSLRVADIVKRLLIFARQTKPIKTLANLNELIENTLKLREYVLKTANIEVVTRFDPELPWTIVDPGQLQQVFLNLIVNAEQEMKKAHGKGTLTITTEKKENNIRMSFKDDGPGITKENLERLFEPFFTTKDIGEGTGLGLSLSRSIVLEHNGTLNVESVSGHGATFIIELPIIESLPSDVVTSTLMAKVEPAAIKKGKILVVDDEPGVRALLEKILTQSGHSVDTIGDANKAIDKLDAGVTYDVILTDIRMPGMSGTEMYSYILKKMPKMKNRIIFITGDVMGADIKVFLTQKNLPYLAKPFDIKLLKDKIEVIMGGSQ